MLVHLQIKGITRKIAEQLLGELCITCNKNSVPNDPQKPVITSGIRLGSPAISTRGFGLAESRQVAHMVADVLHAPHSSVVQQRVREQVQDLCERFPVYR